MSYDFLPLNMEQFDDITQRKSTHKEELLEIFFANASESILTMERNCPYAKRKKWIDALDELYSTSSVIGAQELQRLCAEAKQLEDSTEEEKIKMVVNIKIHVQRLRAFVRNTRY